MNVLFCSAGRRCELLKDCKLSQGSDSFIVAADASRYAPALYFADKSYIVPSIDDESYISKILEICKDECIDAVITCIDPEIPVLARWRREFEEIGVLLLAPMEETAEICLNKLEFYKALCARGLPGVPTYGSIEEFDNAHGRGECGFPVFVKPRKGSGSVGARPVDNRDALITALREDSSLVIQPYLDDALDLDADIYIDAFSRKAVSVFLKKKLSTTIGGANKTVSIKDPNLLALAVKLAESFDFIGPIDVDFFIIGDKYLISEVNPRFGGAYIHAFGAGVDFFKLIEKNIGGEANEVDYENYSEGIYMLMYDSAVIEALG